MPQNRTAVIAAVASILTIVVTAALVVTTGHRFKNMSHSISSLEESERTLVVEVGKLRAETALPKAEDAAEVLSWLRTPVLPNLELVTLKGGKVKLQRFELAPNADPMRLTAIRAPKGWRPTPDGPEKTLPFEWSSLYVNTFKQPFNADSLLFNCAALANWMTPDSDSALIKPYVDLLLRRLSDYVTETPNGGHLVTYRFSYSFHDKQLNPGWVSAYGNASALAGLVYLAKSFRDDRLMAEAELLFKGLSSVGTPKWVTAIDDRQFIWFEEYPLDGSRKAHVFNGHIWSTFALAQYYQATHDPLALTLTDAGITTIKRYFDAYRYPGRVIRYDLYADYNPDYAPWNMINLQRALYALTSDAEFHSFEDKLLADMAYEPPTDGTRPDPD